MYLPRPTGTLDCRSCRFGNDPFVLNNKYACVLLPDVWDGPVLALAQKQTRTTKRARARIGDPCDPCHGGIIIFQVMWCRIHQSYTISQATLPLSNVRLIVDFLLTLSSPADVVLPSFLGVQSLPN